MRRMVTAEARPAREAVAKLPVRDIQFRPDEIAHQLAPGPTGMPLEVYVFTETVDWIEYEDIQASLASLVAAGIPIFKLQEAAALRVPEVTQDLVDQLRPFADTVYLTQTVEMRDGKLTRYLNLEDAFAAWDADPGPREWRTHFHVPVFLDDLGAFKTTRFAIEDALAFHKATPVSDQLEIETYTWDVLPDHLKTGDIVDYVEMELDWVKGQLLGDD